MFMIDTFLCGLMPADFIHIYQGYFTGMGQSYDRPIVSEATLKNMGKQNIQI